VKRPTWMPERAILLLAAVGVAMSVALSVLVFELREQQYTARFQGDAHDVALSIQRAVDDCINELDSISTLLRIFPHTNQEEFALFVRPYLRRSHVTKALEWIPRVARAERTEFEARGNAIWKSYAITEKSADGALVLAADRDEYFPVLYVEPFAGNERAVGFDVASEPNRREALLRMRRTRESAATAPITLVQENAKQKGILIFGPIEAPAGEFPGFALGVFRIGDMIDAALPKSLTRRMAIEVYDTAPSAESLLYQSGDVLKGGLLNRGLSTEVGVAGRIWLIRCRPGECMRLGYEPWLVLFGSLLFTVLISVHFTARARSALELRRAHDALAAANTRLASQAQELETSLHELTAARERLVQEEKLTSVGRLAAGIAHEINTPVQFVGDSISFLHDALRDLTTLIGKYQAVARAHGDGKSWEEWDREVAKAEEDADLAYLLENAPSAVERALDGLSRVATIVRSMKEFAHPDLGEATLVDLNHAIQNTLTMARNEYKYVADLTVDLGTLPAVRCHIGELNQTILNIVVNAAHAIGDVVKQSGNRGTISVRTRHEGESVFISISDTGAGIPREIWNRIYDPFFTTKEVGKGTGQGLAIARTVIVKHGGDLSFETDLGKGTTFHIRLPVDGKPSDTSGTMW